MSKLKTIFLLFLAGFILVGCSDPRAEDKKILVDELMDLEDLTNDQAECAVNALSDNMSDNSWKGMVIEVSGSDEEYDAWAESLTEEDEEKLLKEFNSGVAVALECDGIPSGTFR